MKKKKGMQYAEYVKSEKGKPSWHHLFNNVYEINYYLIIGQEKKTKEYFEHLSDHNFFEGLVFSPINGQIVIWLQKKGDLDVFAHELLHAISETARQKSLSYNLDQDEHLAYLMSYLFRAFYFAVK